MVHAVLSGAVGAANMHVLHSTIDVDTAMKAICQTVDDVQVILATNVAESSVTIPSVVHVVDLCLTNHVQYVAESGSTSPNTVFISKSQSDQRKGRAGRLRDGWIWRMVPPTSRQRRSRVAVDGNLCW